MKRVGVRKSARYYGGGVAVVALVALTLFVVLPAFGSNVNDQVPPRTGLGSLTTPSPNGVMPVDIGVGGNQSCSSQGLFQGMTGVQETTDPSPPQSGTALYPSGHGWNFKLISGALPGFTANKGQDLVVDSQGNAAIVGIAIKGGNDNLTYDYRTTAQGWVSVDTLLHAPASKFTAGTNPETGITQYYGVSQIVICYKTPLTTISGNAYKDVSGAPPISGLTVTLHDMTTSKTQTTPTDTSGNYSFAAAPGDDYTVCISKPTTFGNVQTFPATDGTGGDCTAGTNGYSITNLSGNQTNKNFGFQPLGSVSGTIYQDLNGYNTKIPPQLTGQPDGKFQSALDSPVGNGWIATLYKGSQLVGSQTTSNGNGQYSFTAQFDTSQTYTVCVTPPGGTFGQSEPLPTALDSCTPLNAGALQKGQQFQPSSAGATLTENFGVDPSQAQPCDPPVPFGIDLTGDNPPGSLLKIQLAACKPNQTFVFNSGILGAPPDTTPFVSVWASDQTLTQVVPLVEHIVFPDPLVNGAPKYTGLSYTDTFPYDPAAAEPMATCNSDPRTGDMTLPSGFMDSDLQALMPATNAGTSTPATSCVLSVKTYVDANGKTWLEAYALTDVDGFTKPH
jgi:hypothetical protein